MELELRDNMIENFPQPEDTFIERLKRPFSFLLADGVIQFQYCDDMIFAKDQGGFILRRQTFEEVVDYWSRFYEHFSDEEIDWINENKHLYVTKRAIVEPKVTVTQQPRKGIIYILFGNEYCKIGKTINLKARLAQLTPKLPFEVELIHTIESDDIDTLEEELHERYADKRTNGEWFQLSESDLEYLKQMS